MRTKRPMTGALLFSLALLVFGVAAQAGKHPPAKPVDLNVANAKELQELPGVGRVTAQRIIEMRQKSGRFHRVEDLLVIRGISQRRLDALRPYVTVSAPPSPSPAAPKSSQPPKKAPAQ